MRFIAAFIVLSLAPIVCAHAVQGAPQTSNRVISGSKMGARQRQTLPEKIYFSSDRDGKLNIFSMNPDGSAQKNLTHSADMEIDPSASPDGRRIVFVVAHPEEKRFELWTMDPDGQHRRRVLKVTGVPAAPVWSPDGARIAYFLTSLNVRHSSLYIIDSAGKHPAELCEGAFPAWSPNGHRILFMTLANHGLPPHAAVLDLQTRKQKDLTKTASLLGIWSPDGKKIAFSAVSMPGGPAVVVVMDSNGAHLKQMTNTSNTDLVSQWSRDGKRLIFLRGPAMAADFKKTEIYSLNVVNGKARELTHNNFADVPGRVAFLLLTVHGSPSPGPPQPTRTP